MFELKDTVPMMISDDYKERFVAEYVQLKIRYKKLYAVLEKYAADKLDFKPTCPIEILYEQLDHMEAYLSVLETRAKYEGIELPAV
mgnify:FL=1